MKKKRAADLVESPQELTEVKKLRSHVNIIESGGSTSMNESEPHAATNLHIHDAGKALKSKRKKCARSDLNQNGEPDSGDSIEPQCVLIKKKNGLPVRTDTDSPSDLQPLRSLVGESQRSQSNLAEDHESLAIGNTQEKIELRKKRNKKLASNKASLSENEKAVDIDYSGPKIMKKKRNIENIEDFETTSGKSIPKKSKKKVRIDETEGLKVKKELAEAESHFSARELPAKIIKSKSNKNLTEEVKVSPLTVQASRKDKKNTKKLKSDIDIKDNYDENSSDKMTKGGKDDDINSINEEVQDDNEHLEDGTKNGVGIEAATSEESDLEVYYINKNAEKEAKKRSPKIKKSILMPKEDQLVLVQRMQEVIPQDDNRSYNYRINNLEWQKVAFKNYTLEDCQIVWSKLLKKVRHYRLLIEIIQDVRTVIEKNDLRGADALISNSSNKKFPDKPKRPLSAYLLYLTRKKSKMAKERPDLDAGELNKYICETYQNLPTEKKQKYELLAAKNKEKYQRQLEDFYAKHPELRKVIVKKESKKTKKEKKQPPPKRPENPFKLFMKSELTREEVSEEDKAEFKEVCREKWRQLSDLKKLEWINRAEEHYLKYQEELKQYMAKYPDYTPKMQTIRPLLSKKEMNLRDKLSGKPRKPPNSAYGLFSSMVMQSSEIVSINTKERWIYISNKWKAMTDEEREQYKQLLTQVTEQYEKDFKVYLDSLPEDKRQVEILNNLPKKKKITPTKPSTSGKKKPSTRTKSRSQRTKQVSKEKEKLQNPTAPPRSAFKYFAEKYGGENPKEAWKSLDASGKEKYEEELSILKDKYIKEFEVYLKSLSKEELAEFCAKRSAQGEYSSSGESDSESESDDDDESSNNSSNGSESENDSDDN